MFQVFKIVLTAAAAFVCMTGGQSVYAESTFKGGGVLQEGIDALQQSFSQPGNRVERPRLSVVDQKSLAVGFTPRFAGVPIELSDGVSIDRGSLLKSRFAGTSAQRAANRSLELAQSHDLGLVKVDLSAIAGFSGEQNQDYGQSSTFGVGGGLKFDSLGGLRLDAFYSRRDESFGFARDSMTAGLGYDFGSIGTRLSLSNVSQYDLDGIEADEQKVWSVGGQMKLSSSFVVGGDLAYSTGLDGTDDTSGVVKFRFNF